MIGVLLSTAPYCPLCEEAITKLAGVKPYLIEKWVDELSSSLYRDEGANGAFVSDICQLPISLSAIAASVELTSKTPMRSWELLVSRQ